MINTALHNDAIFERCQEFYGTALGVLEAAKIPYLVGGAFALRHYTGIARDTKDFDIFVLRSHTERILTVLSEAGYRTAMTFPHWLAKAFHGEYFLDIIFGSGNGICPVDEQWFQHSVDAEILGRRVKICPPEEILWSKSFIMERERFDGADVLHLIRATAERLDWDRLLRRFNNHWRVLLAHLVLFGFVYPAERHRIPLRIFEELTSRLGTEQTTDPCPDRICQGTLLSREHYLVDIEQWGHEDARLIPHGTMTAEHIALWTPQAENKAQPSSANGHTQQ